MDCHDDKMTRMARDYRDDRELERRCRAAQDALSAVLQAPGAHRLGKRIEDLNVANDALGETRAEIVRAWD